MKFPRWNSFHTKLLTTYILLISLGTSVMAGYMLWSFYSYFLRSRQTDLENWATAIGESVADAMEAERLDRVQVIVQRYGAPETVALRVFSPQGQLLASSSFQQDQAIQDWRTVPGIEVALRGQAVQGRSKGVLSPDDRLYIAQPIWRNGRMLGVVRMSITLEQVQRQFTRVIMTVLGALILTILICAFLSYHLARSLSHPIERMRNFAIQVGGGAFGDKLIVRQS
ncbi:MAG TPA: two-component sensor histidine kinase, partial [Allocoleopsis sp.]